MESRLELFYPFELFLKLYYLFPKDVLDSLILYGSASLEVLYYSTLYFDFGKILDNYFLSSGILIVFNKFWVLHFFKGNLKLDLGASNF